MAYCSLTLEAARILSVSIQNTYSVGVGWLDVRVWNTAMYANWKVKARPAWQARHFVHWNVILRGRRTFTLLDVAGYLYEKKEEGIARFAPWRCDAIARPSCATLDGHVVGADWWPRGGRKAQPLQPPRRVRSKASRSSSRWNKGMAAASHCAMTPDLFCWHPSTRHARKPMVTFTLDKIKDIPGSTLVVRVLFIARRCTLSDMSQSPRLHAHWFWNWLRRTSVKHSADSSWCIDLHFLQFVGPCLWFENCWFNLRALLVLKQHVCCASKITWWVETRSSGCFAASPIAGIGYEGLSNLDIPASR